MSVQGAVIHWDADHHRHHAFTDEEGDPHSPHTHDGEGWRGVLSGLWHSHMGWLFEGQRTSAKRFAPDLKKDPLIRWVDKYFPLWALLGLAIPFVLGFALSGGSLFAGFTAFVWAGLVRVFLLHHATWSVNSICHMYGSKPFVIEDESRDNWMVAMVSLGEGWHHSHHAFPLPPRATACAASSPTRPTAVIRTLEQPRPGLERQAPEATSRSRPSASGPSAPVARERQVA